MQGEAQFLQRFLAIKGKSGDMVSLLAAATRSHALLCCRQALLCALLLLPRHQAYCSGMMAP